MNRREHIALAMVAPQPRGAAVALERVVEGEEVETEHGRFFCSRCTLVGSAFHGHSRVSDLARLSMDTAAFLAGSQTLCSFSPEEGLFLDTETTVWQGAPARSPSSSGSGGLKRELS